MRGLHAQVEDLLGLGRDLPDMASPVDPIEDGEQVSHVPRHFWQPRPRIAHQERELLDQLRACPHQVFSPSGYRRPGKKLFR